MKKIMVVFGTRPEAIKMCPLVLELKQNKNFQTIVCVSGQHKEMLAQVLDVFGIVPEYDMAIMKGRQTLFDVTAAILGRIQAILEQERPDLVLVHGDTTTAFATALAAFYLQIKVGHVEAGLRTYNLEAPFPEEFNRQAIDIVSAFYFAPTDRAKENLLKEGKDCDKIYVTGNTAIDAMKTTIREGFRHEQLDWAKDARLILLTAHRRENLGGGVDVPMERMFCAIRRIVEEFKDVKVLYPIHFNPAVREAADKIFGATDRIRIIEPLDVVDFHNFMKAAYLILTDSGGIQEEAPSLGKPVLVMRETTERPEGIAAGTLKLVGTAEQTIYENFRRLLTDDAQYEAMSRAVNPYGDGTASVQIARIIEEHL